MIMPKNLTPNQFDYAGIYVEGQRSNFRFKKAVASSFMSGVVVPCGDPIRVFPGVKLDLELEAVIRGNTMLCPPLDSLFIDVFAIWVPDRIVWTHQPQFLGENDQTAWTQSTEYIYPSQTYSSINASLREISAVATDVGTVLGNVSLIAQYGLANVGSMNSTLQQLPISVIPMRGYYALWNHIFRDENYQRPVLFSKGDTGSEGEFGYVLRNYYLNDAETIRLDSIEDLYEPYQRFYLMPANKFHDAFTSLLPQPQFDDGEGVALPLGGTAQLTTSNKKYSFVNGSNSFYLGLGTADSGYKLLQTSNGLVGLQASGSGSSSQGNPSYTNLVVDLSSATSSTINQLRTAVMYQRYLEALARGGRRVPEYYESIYGVKNSAVNHDYPEILSHSRYLIGVNQVVATADSEGNDWTSHLGDTGAYSLTRLSNVPLCEKDFTEFGYLHIVYCVRAENRYSSFVPEHFTRQTLLDEYNPFFDHIGDVAVPNYLVNIHANTYGNFGFQEAWWFERTQLALATGAVNKSYGSLKWWTISEEFSSSLNQCTGVYLTFDPAVLDDIFVSNYAVYPQFVGDFLIHGVKSARMSQHSIPGITGRI